MVEEQAQGAIIDIMKKFFKNIGLKIFRMISAKAEKEIRYSVENHRMNSIRQLMRKNLNSGIHTMGDLSKTTSKLLINELKKHKQDFHIAFDKESGKYTVTTTGSNKAFCDKVIDNIKEADNREGLESIIKRCSKKADEINKRNAAERAKGKTVDIQKSREIGARTI